MGNDFYNDFFGKIVVKIFVACEGLYMCMYLHNVPVYTRKMSIISLALLIMLSAQKYDNNTFCWFNHSAIFCVTNVSGCTLGCVNLNLERVWVRHIIYSHICAVNVQVHVCSEMNVHVCVWLKLGYCFVSWINFTWCSVGSSRSSCVILYNWQQNTSALLFQNTNRTCLPVLSSVCCTASKVRSEIIPLYTLLNPLKTAIVYLYEYVMQCIPQKFNALIIEIPPTSLLISCESTYEFIQMLL